MKNDIRTIKNELIDITSEKVQRERERQEEKKKKELKRITTALIYTTIKKSLNNGAALTEIYNNRQLICEQIKKEIAKEVIEVADAKSWNSGTKVVRKYDFPDYEIDYIIEDIFTKEYKRATREEKERVRILKEDITNRTLDYLKKMCLDIPKDIDPYCYFKALKREDVKTDIISHITQNNEERIFLEQHYNKIVDALQKSKDIEKQTYTYIKPKTNKQTKNTKLALPWKILAYKTAIKKIWKL